MNNENRIRSNSPQKRSSTKRNNPGRRNTREGEAPAEPPTLPLNQPANQTGSAGASPSRRLPDRKHPIHGVFFQADQPAIVCVTVCTKFKEPWLADAVVHQQLKDVWKNANLWRVGRYVIMPDHIHLFACEYGDIQLDNWVRYWKSQFTKLHSDKSHRWQTDHWDRRIRTDAEYEDAWNYVYWNPVRAKLVTDPEQWPFSGAINDLPWD